MKKIIGGRMYNTDTAREIGCWENSYSVRDFRWCSETLYQKRNGEYFIHGEGGPMTRYADRVGDNCWSDGEMITPMSYDEARSWAENYLSADKCEEIFGTVSEGDEDVDLHITISQEDYDKLCRIAEENYTNPGAVLKRLIEQA